MDKPLFRVGDLPACCTMTKIVSPIRLSHTSADLSSHFDRTSQWAIDQCFFSDTDRLIGNILCKHVEIHCTASQALSATLVFEGLWEDDFAEVILESLCSDLTYSLFGDVVNWHNGIPFFLINPLEKQLTYGNEADGFSHKLLTAYASMSMQAYSQMKDFKVSLPITPDIHNKRKLLLHAMKSDDPIGKYIRLYRFF